MLTIVISIVVVMSIFSGTFVLAALMLSSKHSAAEPWQEHYAASGKAEPIVVPIHRAEASS